MLVGFGHYRTEFLLTLEFGVEVLVHVALQKEAFSALHTRTVTTCVLPRSV